MNKMHEFIKEWGVNALEILINLHDMKDDSADKLCTRMNDEFKEAARELVRQAEITNVD